MHISRPFTARFAEQPEGPPIPEGGPKEYVPDIVFIVARDGRILYVNQALGGVAGDDVVGSSIYEWISSDQHASLGEALDGVFGQGEPRGMELTGLPRHAPHAWYECRITPTHRAGEVVSATVIARDITRHRLAVEESNRRYIELARLFDERGADLAQVQARLAEVLAARDADVPFLHRFRALLDAAGEAIFVTDPASGEIADVNETACRWLRLGRETVLGRTAKDLGLEFAIQVPEDQDITFTETRDTRRPMIVTGGVQRRQDGSTFPVEVAVARHRWGDQEFILAVVRDVKEREHGLDLLRRREAAYHDLFEQSWDGVYLTTRSGQVIAANPAAADLLGYTREEIVGQGAQVFFPMLADIRRFQEAMASDGMVRDLDVQLRRKDGKVFPALLSATRRYGSDGSLQGHQCILRPRLAADPGVARQPATATAHVSGAVLVVDTADEARAETVEMLRRAGIPILETGSLARAIELMREHAGDLTAVVLGVEAGERGVDLTVEEFRRIDPGAPIIISSADDRLVLAGQLADLEITAFVDRPAHPLALIQRIRELAARRTGG